MKIQLNQGVELDIDNDIIFNNLAKQLGLPADWRDLYIGEGKLFRLNRVGPIELEEIISTSKVFIDQYTWFIYLYRILK